MQRVSTVNLTHSYFVNMYADLLYQILVERKNYDYFQ